MPTCASIFIAFFHLFVVNFCPLATCCFSSPRVPVSGHHTSPFIYVIYTEIVYMMRSGGGGGVMAVVIKCANRVAYPFKNVCVV